jgi:hypothetical protein
VAAHRTAEKLAVTLEDAMVHAPLENLIFGSDKKLRKDLEGDARKVLVQMGDKAFRKLVMDMLRRRTGPNLDSDVSLIATQTLEDVIAITLSARRALGEARLATATKVAEFMRVIFGSDDTEVAAGGGYYCQLTHPNLTDLSLPAERYKLCVAIGFVPAICFRPRSVEWSWRRRTFFQSR